MKSRPFWHSLRPTICIGVAATPTFSRRQPSCVPLFRSTLRQGISIGWGRSSTTFVCGCILKPHNPRAYLYKAKHRKYVRQVPFQQRYAQCLQQMPRPLFAMVQVGEGRAACCSSSSALPAVGMHVADAHEALDATPGEG